MAAESKAAIRDSTGDGIPDTTVIVSNDSLGLRRQRGTFTSNAFSLTSDYVIDRVETREYYRWNTFNDTSGGDNTNTQAIGASDRIDVVRGPVPL